jgi:hypothetical protein
MSTIVSVNRRTYPLEGEVENEDESVAVDLCGILNGL